MSAYLDALKAAVAAKSRESGKPTTEEKVHVPHDVRPATAGTHVASDGKPYTITYQNGESK